MDLRNIIIEGKICRLEQLTRTGQREVAANPQLQQLIDENAALNNVEEGYPTTPRWEYLRYGVLARAGEIREAELEEQRIEHLPMIHRINLLKPWFAQTMAAITLVAIICILAYLLPYGEKPSMQTTYSSRKSVQWYNYALASQSGQCEEGKQQRVNHP